ncbi:hypothetical protein KR100_08860 [Synechococcus sp. KORDI-100]|uniref:hypothetical protein n=1 Tax=Synechococcus sp. KORDI-100 TaxID=1280380 RepID=UPI0004E033F5|nr:hypothetical protein [Synechococcus sp. KORDI-100]AII43470.1 hypothetical protein KR100_08860 [Synechococcus sp. KORDI-100]MED5383145.1 hypothetical protein [Cyanobacteriota bacterium]
MDKSYHRNDGWTSPPRKPIDTDCLIWLRQQLVFLSGEGLEQECKALFDEFTLDS